MNEDKYIANEAFFTNIIKHTNDGGKYLWQDNKNVYIINKNKIKPCTVKGYNDLSKAVIKSFMDVYVELPDEKEDIQIKKSTEEVEFNILNLSGPITTKKDLNLIKKLTYKSCYVCSDLGKHYCAQCKKAFYCSKDCQILHWKIHKKECKIKT
jgi:hypothetical protein